MQAPGFSASGKELLILAGLAVGLYLFTKHEVKTAAKAVGEAVNPLSQNNIINKAVNATGAALTNTKPGDWSLGGWIYDMTHEPYDPNAPVKVVPKVSTKK
jgi:hypothetical protein